jgi:hypothetical protein
MASTDSTSLAQVFDALVALEDPFQRLDSNATRALVIRDARETIAALDADQDRLLGTIAALNVEKAELHRYAGLLAWIMMPLVDADEVRQTAIHVWRVELTLEDHKRLQSFLPADVREVGP